MLPFWITIPAITAVISGGSIFFFTKQLRRFHKFMGYTIIFDGLFLLLSGMIQYGADSFYTPTYLLYILMMLTSPLFYYFALRYSLKENGVKLKDLWLLEAVILFVAITLAISVIIPISDKNNFIALLRGAILSSGQDTTGLQVMWSLNRFGYIFFLLEQLFVQIFCFISLKGYQKLLETYYSNLDRQSISSITIIFVLLALRFVANAYEAFVPEVNGLMWINILQAVIYAAFFIVVALYVCKVEFTVEELTRRIELQKEKQQAPAAGEIIDTKLGKLIDENFFLNPDVDLLTLSSKIQVNSKYVAEFIRKKYGESFLVFVNRLRVEYAISLMDGSKLSLQEISEQSGFVSVSTFYRNFTKIKGISPSDFRKNV